VAEAKAKQIAPIREGALVTITPEITPARPGNLNRVTPSQEDQPRRGGGERPGDENGEVLDSRLLQGMPGQGEWVTKANAACVEQAKRLVFDPARAADAAPSAGLAGGRFLLD